MGDLMTGGGDGVGGFRPDERALKHAAHSLDRRFFLVLQRSTTSPVISVMGRSWHRKVNCEYACFAQFHSRNEFLGGSYYAMLSVEGTLMQRGSRKRGTGNVGIKNFGNR